MKTLPPVLEQYFLSKQPPRHPPAYFTSPVTVNVSAPSLQWSHWGALRAVLLHISVFSHCDLRLPGSKSFIKQWDVSILTSWQWSRAVTVVMCWPLDTMCASCVSAPCFQIHQLIILILILITTQLITLIIIQILLLLLWLLLLRLLLLLLLLLLIIMMINCIHIVFKCCFPAYMHG